RGGEAPDVPRDPRALRPSGGAEDPRAAPRRLPQPGAGGTAGGAERAGHATAVPLAAAGEGRVDQRTAAGVRRAADAAGAPADGPCAGDPPVAAPLRRGHRPDDGEPRPLRRRAHAPRIARLAGDGVREPGVVAEEDAPAPGDLERLPADVRPGRDGSCGGAE